MSQYVFNLTKAIDLAATEFQLYTQLSELAPCPKWDLPLATVAKQSQNDLLALSQLYTCLVGTPYTPQPRNITFSTFPVGLETAFFFDWTGVDLYYELVAGTSLQSVQKIVQKALISKQQHQKLLTWIFFSLNLPNMNCANPQTVLGYQFASEVAASSFMNLQTGGTVGSQGGISGSQGGGISRSQGGASGSQAGSVPASQGSTPAAPSA
jgi:uncharacterized membrane protein YgcG